MITIYKYILVLIDLLHVQYFPAKYVKAVLGISTSQLYTWTCINFFFSIFVYYTGPLAILSINGL